MCRKGSKGEAGALVLHGCFITNNISGAGGIEATSCACASWVSASLGSEAALGPEPSLDSLQVGRPSCSMTLKNKIWVLVTAVLSVNNLAGLCIITEPFIRIIGKWYLYPCDLLVTK